MNIIILGSESKYLTELEGLVKSQVNSCSVQVFSDEQDIYHGDVLNNIDVCLLEINTRNFGEAFQIVDKLLASKPMLKVAFFCDYILNGWSSKINERQIYLINKNSSNKVGEIKKFLIGHTKRIKAKAFLTMREEEVLQLTAKRS